jgi:putative phage-type endonuclease
MKEIHLEQGTADWLAWRAGKDFVDIFGVAHAALTGLRITATAASVCGGYSPFSTPHQLWGEMLGLRQREIATFVMQRGTALEPKARKAYTDIVGEEYEALCIESTATPWIAASLDGVDLLRTRGVEIKCPMSDSATGSHALALQGVVAPYYFDQIQWQMLSSDNQLKEIDYFSYAPAMGKAQPITVQIDLLRQAELIDAALKLRLAVMTKVPLSGSEFDQAAKAFLVLNRRLKAIEAECDDAKNRVKALAGGKAIQGGGVMVIVGGGEGRTSWEKVAMDLVAKLNLEDCDLDLLKQTYKGKTSTTISVKEAADADAIYNEIMDAQRHETSIVQVLNEKLLQPEPIW